jgi:hypothetical protein
VDAELGGIIMEAIRNYLSEDPILAAFFVVKKDQFEAPARNSGIKVVSSDAPSDACRRPSIPRSLALRSASIPTGPWRLRFCGLT